MKTFLKKLIPEPLLKLYHYMLANLAVIFYGHPSRKMLVIGITGTKGKSSTSYLTAKMLEGVGYQVGLSSTVMFKVARREWLNDKKMTMLGRFQLQKLLSQMVKAGCQYAVIETSSEGIAQFRHFGIDYDVLVFTGLTPEHIESHGSFEKYKSVKLSIFQDLERREIKKLRNKAIKKVIITNGESEHSREFSNFNVDEKINYQLSIINYQNESYEVHEKSVDMNGIKFKINNTSFNLNLLAKFNILNSLAAISVGLSQNISLEKIKQALEQIKGVPGRMEVISAKDFKIIVDYAYETKSMENVYQEVTTWPHQRIITVFGGTGGGRDKWRRPKMGELAAKYADIIILTTDDPYDDKVEQINNDIERGIKNFKGELYKIIDRKAAIKKAIDKAQKNDIILVLGKGCEQKMALANGKYVDWDDRQVVKEYLFTKT